MTQLHCFVPEEVARQAQRRAEQVGLSLSRYLAELVKRDAAQDKVRREGFAPLQSFPFDDHAAEHVARSGRIC